MGLSLYFPAHSPLLKPTTEHPFFPFFWFSTLQVITRPPFGPFLHLVLPLQTIISPIDTTNVLLYSRASSLYQNHKTRRLHKIPVVELSTESYRNPSTKIGTKSSKIITTRAIHHHEFRNDTKSANNGLKTPWTLTLIRCSKNSGDRMIFELKKTNTNEKRSSLESEINLLWNFTNFLWF